MIDAVRRLDRPKLSARTLVVLYATLAVVAGIANLCVQAATGALMPRAPLMIPILAGTAVGFGVKYLLDKRFIFFDGFETHAAEARKLSLYGLSGVGTTVIFWGTELAFYSVWHTDLGKYSGAVIGLAIGNWVKYLLDKRFAFSGAGR